MSTFGFRSLVLGVIASILVTATGLLAWLAYNTVYDQILIGFDRKLLAVSGTVGALTDGAEHAEYQRPYAVTRFIGGRAGQAWGWGATRSAVVRIDLETSAVVENHPLPWRPRSLVWLDATEQLFVQSPEGRLFEVMLAEHGAELRSLDLEPIESVWISDGASLLQWNGEQILAAAPAGLGEERGEGQPVLAESPAALLPPEQVTMLARDRVGMRWVGWNASSSRLIAFDDAGALLQAAELDLGGRAVFGLTVQEGDVFLASDALLRYDWDEGVLVEDFSPGYFNEEDPFVARHAPLYRSLRERARLTFLYTEVFLSGDQIRYVLDGSTGDDHSPPGYLDSVPEDDIDAVVRAQVEGTPFVSGIREWDIWGLVKVSAAPIRDPDGKVVALAGADVDIGVIRSKTRNALFAVLGVGGALMLVSGLVSLSVAQTITRPLRDIKNAALRIAAGQYGERLQNTTADEIGRLAGSLDRLSLTLRRQEEASNASQAELLSGRLDEAVRAALLPDRARPRRFDMTFGAQRLIAQFDETASQGPIGFAVASGKLQVLAARMGTADSLSADGLFASMPELRWLLLWNPANRGVQWQSRDDALVLKPRAGGAHALGSGEHTLAPDAQACLDDGEILIDRGVGA